MNNKRDKAVVDFAKEKNRLLERSQPGSGLRIFHIVIPSEAGNIEARVLDYHLMGASIEMSRVDFEKFKELKEEGELNFFIGQKCIQFGVKYSVCWFDEIACHSGLAFKEEVKDWVKRDLRIPTHSKVKPSLSGVDPIDPNRRIFFSVENVSSNGMMLSTSLSNKHLFPGMDLKEAKLTVPGKEPVTLDLSLQNVHISNDKSLLMVGTLVRSKTKNEYTKALQEYLAALGDLTGIDHSEFRSSEFFTKKLKSALTFKPVLTESEYKKVLELRFMGYGHKGKVRQGQTLEDMGEGLLSEGVIIGAYLGKMLVASVEIRFGTDSKGFRYCSEHELKKIGIHNKSKYAEVNKLVVHPSYQGSDALLGIFHRMHAIGISEGGLGAIIAATDKLKPLYLKVGARDTGLRYAHPHLKDVSLNILVIDASVYLGESEFNPFLWKTVYGALSDYLAENLVTKKIKNSKLRYFKGMLHYALNTYSTKKIKKNESLAQTNQIKKNKIEEKSIHSKVNGKSTDLTQQHLHVSTIKPYIIFADKKIGKAKVDKILNEIGLSRDYFSLKSNWVSSKFLDIFLDHYTKHAPLEEISLEAGRISFSKEILGTGYYFLKNFGTHKGLVKIVSQFSPKMNKTRTVKVLELEDKRALIEVGIVKGFTLPKHRESCLNWQSSLKHAGLLAGGSVNVKKLSCAYEGSPVTIYEITWKSSSKKILIGLEYLAAACLILSFIAIIKSLAFNSFAGIAPGFFLILSTIYFIVSKKKLHSELKERDEISFKLQEEADIKYADLQEAKVLIEHRYQESTLLDKISAMIQGSSDVGGILRTGLNQSCNLLEYSRAFVMILNTDSKMLETAAINGLEHIDQDLNNFCVDVSIKRENPALLSSVYHSGQSVLINNVEDHLFQLNEASQKLIKKLGAKKFVMVAIPSEKHNWGVIVAEKSMAKSDLSKKDVVLLERVAQMMGVALDKHAALQNETRLRKSFQRYVPASIVEELTTNKANHLGGIEKNICALFLDIRGFTKISSTLGAQMTVDFLNRFYSFAEPIFTKHGGTVDKYLGDGVLVTWGAIQSTENVETKGVTSALELLAGLEDFNSSSAALGLPTIQIGIGVHSGPAIVGNIGSANRMEFTAIGHTVNYASRLEALNKVYGSSLCLSDQVLSKLGSDFESRFSRITGVAVRGVTGETNIAILDHHMTNKQMGAA